MSKPHILCASACNGQEKTNKPSKLVCQGKRLRVLFKRRGSGHVRTPGGNSTSSLLNPICIFRTYMVGAYCVNQPVRFTNGALNFLAFCSIYFYSTTHSALLKNLLSQATMGRGQPRYAFARQDNYGSECMNGMKEGNLWVMLALVCWLVNTVNELPMLLWGKTWEKPCTFSFFLKKKNTKKNLIFLLLVLLLWRTMAVYVTSVSSVGSVSHSCIQLGAFAAGSLFFLLAHTALPTFWSTVDTQLWGKQRVKIYGLIYLMKEARENKPHWSFYI